jgi:hypothetical protein
MRRSSARLAAVEAASSDSLSSLPQALSHKVLLLLPLDERLRCSEVSRRWRAMLAVRSLWARLDLTSGVTVTNALLRAAVKKAGPRGLEALVVPGDADDVTLAALCSVLAANARGALRQVRVGRPCGDEHVKMLLEAGAPRLERLDVDFLDLEHFDEARAALRRAPPKYGAPLRVHTLRVNGNEDARAGADGVLRLPDDAVAGLFADAAAARRQPDWRAARGRVAARAKRAGGAGGRRPGAPPAQLSGEGLRAVARGGARARAPAASWRRAAAGPGCVLREHQQHAAGRAVCGAGGRRAARQRHAHAPHAPICRPLVAQRR